MNGISDGCGIELRPPASCIITSHIMGDTLYARLNSRGKKQFKASGRQSFVDSFGPYASLGLPAHKAALDGNVECLKECFSSFMKDGVPSKDVNGATPLHLAARSNRSDAVKWLLRFTDIPVTVAAKHGETPAHVAAVQGHVESLKQILTADAKGDVKFLLANAVDNSGFSALHLAILKHRNECAKLLISELGAKAVNALNESGVTAVHLAASAGNVEVLQFLSNSKHKKLLTQADNEGASPAYYAAQEGRLEVLQFLCEKCKCDLSVPCNDGLKPIHAASQCGHTNVVKYIVSQLGNQVIFDTTPDGATPLHFATSSEHLHTAQWLINSDARGMLVNMKDGNGDAPAHDAADSGHIPMLKLLLENGADLYAINNDGNTPYSLALSGGNMDTANYVMTYASKSPQRDSGGPVRIFNMQGEMDVADVKKTSDPELSNTPPSPSQLDTYNSNQHEMNGNQRPPGIGSSNSFMGNASQTLQSFEGTIQAPEAREDASAALDMTEDELALFHDNKPLLGAEDHIVVRYSAPSDADPVTTGSAPEEPGYATVSEIAIQEEKRKNKKERKISKKSFLKAISPKKESKTKKSTPSRAISGPELGFKPQFHSNPLMKYGGSIPPTPPPTPATAASTAPSDEAPQHNLEDVEEVDDGGTFAPYATPDPEVVRMKAKRRELEEQDMLKSSENQKLLKDALEDLSGDESPPEIPKQNLNGEDVHGVPSRVSVGSHELSQQGGSKASLGSSIKASDITAKPLSTPPLGQEEAVGSRFPVLKSVKRKLPPVEKKETELSQIKLKKNTDWKRAQYDHPETETASGASDELKKILKKKAAT